MVFKRINYFDVVNKIEIRIYLRNKLFGMRKNNTEHLQLIPFDKSTF